ncbi:hypothetical protein K456DRAFT_1205247 [Colletotrichum gloeosporioides 23]|nr:hypothetical protein K456DRAFT_1205247 [Colletotrichum gloeosporioides 23]
MTLFPLLLDRRPVRRFLIPSKPPVRSAAVLPSPTAQYDLLSTYFQRPASAARPFPLTLGHSSSHQRPCPWICSPQWSAYRWKGANGRRRKGRKRRSPWMRSGPPVGTDTSDQLHRPFSVLLRQRPAGTAPRFSRVLPRLPELRACLALAAGTHVWNGSMCMGRTLCRWNNGTIFLRMHRTRPLSLQREEMRYPVISSPLITTSLSRDSGVNFSESEQPHTTARPAPTTRPVLFNAQNMTNTPTPTPPCGKGSLSATVVSTEAQLASAKKASSLLHSRKGKVCRHPGIPLTSQRQQQPMTTTPSLRRSNKSQMETCRYRSKFAESIQEVKSGQPLSLAVLAAFVFGPRRTV